jgi:hypothetical protein
VFLDLRIIQIEDIDEFAVILWDSFELGKVVSESLYANVVKLLNYYADVRGSISPKGLFSYLKQRHKERVDVIAVI